MEDWRFLASFGIRHLGRGDSRKLLSHFKLTELANICADDIASLDSFGPLKSPRIATELTATWPLIEAMLGLGFNLSHSRETGDQEIASPIKGLNIVFTGKMVTPRKELQDEAIRMGATPQSSVSSKTDILVTGENVGSKKIASAAAHGTKIMTEEDYLAMLNDDSSGGTDESTSHPTIDLAHAEVQQDLFG